MLVTYRFWVVLRDCIKGGSVADGANYCITIDRNEAFKLYNELKKEFF